MTNEELEELDALMTESEAILEQAKEDGIFSESDYDEDFFSNPLLETVQENYYQAGYETGYEAVKKDGYDEGFDDGRAENF